MNRTLLIAGLVSFAALVSAQTPMKPAADGTIYEAGVGVVVDKKCITEVVDVSGAKALKATFAPWGGKWPTAQLLGPWDLTGFTAIEAKITNVGTTASKFVLRADNPGSPKDKPWNSAAAINPLAPGESITLRIDFGFNNYVRQKPAYPLDPSKISVINLTVESPTQDVVLRIDSVKAVN